MRSSHLETKASQFTSSTEHTPSIPFTHAIMHTLWVLRNLSDSIALVPAATSSFDIRSQNLYLLSNHPNKRSVAQAICSIFSCKTVFLRSSTKHSFIEKFRVSMHQIIYLPCTNAFLSFLSCTIWLLVSPFNFVIILLRWPLSRWTIFEMTIKGEIARPVSVTTIVKLLNLS